MKNRKIFFVYLGVFALFLLVSGVYVKSSWEKSRAETSKEALVTARTAGDALNGEMLKQLRGVPEDVGMVPYESIKKRLINIPNADNKIRFAYFYVKNEGKLYIVADSESVDSPDYSPPGQEYVEADPQYFAPFVDGKDHVTVPVSDRWGEWVSVLIPIKNSANGEVSSVFAIDYPAEKWNDAAKKQTTQALVICILLGLVLVVVILIINNNFAAKNNEKNFRSLLETIDDIVIVSDTQGKILYTNKASQYKLGYRTVELLKMRAIDLRQKDKQKEAELFFGEILSGKMTECPIPLQKKDGTILPVTTRVWLGRWNGSESVFGVSKELTNEQQLLQKFSKIFDINPSIMAVSTFPDRILTDVNTVFIKKLGYTKEEVIGKTSAELGFFVEPEKQQEIVDSLAKKGAIYGLNLKIKSKSGKILDGVFSGEVVEVQGKKYFIAVMDDQTGHLIEAKKLKKALRDSERLNKLMIGRELEMMNLKKELAMLRNSESSS